MTGWLGPGCLHTLGPQGHGLARPREVLTGEPARRLGFLPAWWLVLWGPVFSAR